MPTATDLVTDLPADFETFGQAVATSMADLLGGTTGQVLSKASNTNMDFTWVTSDDANAIQNAIVDAKGDLIAATAADTPARLAVGTNGQTLMADSSAATGLTWAAPNGFTYVTGRYYGSPIYAAVSASTIYAADITYYVPFFVRESRSFAKIAIISGSAFSGTASVRLGIYNSSAANVPTTVVLDAGLVAPTTTSTEYSITINQTLNVGWYFLAVNTVTAATSNSLYAFNGTTFPTGFDMGSSTMTATNFIGYRQTSANVSAGFATASSPTAFLSPLPLVKLVA